MLINKVLELQPINYYTLKNEFCIYIGENVYKRNREGVDALREELLNMKFLIVARRVLNDQKDYYIFMSSKHLFCAQRTEFNNFAITSIQSGREFDKNKKYYYYSEVFLITIEEGTAVFVGKREKVTSSKKVTTNRGMSSDVMGDLCDAIDDYFFNKKDGRQLNNRCDKRMESQVMVPLKSYTKYEDMAEQLAAYGADYLAYDRRDSGHGKDKQSVYSFYSSGFDSEKETYVVGDKVVVETITRINDEQMEMMGGIIIGREVCDDGVRFDIEFPEQFDHWIVPERDGRIYLSANEAQKRVREDVIGKIENGYVDSQYMYQLFSDFTTAGYEEQPGWEEFYEELMKKKYPPNRSQMEAIKKGIETKDIQLVLGPPGTGKTTVILSWVEYFIRHGKKVLVSSQNNAAVDNVLARLSDNKAARVIRVGNIDKIQEDCKKYAVSEKIEATAERYLANLTESTRCLSIDKDLIINELPQIKKTISTLSVYSENSRKYWSYAGALNSTIKTIKDSYDEIERLKNSFSDTYDEYLKKGIALKVGENKNFIWKLLNSRKTAKIKKIYVQLEHEMEECCRLIKEKAIEYDSCVVKLETFVNDEDYKRCKAMYRQGKLLAKEHFNKLELTGPYESPKLPSNYYSVSTDDQIAMLNAYEQRLRETLDNIEYLFMTVADWRAAIESKRSEIVSNLVIQSANVVGATCIGINTRRQFKQIKFDVSIIDESGQIQIHNAIVPMSRAPKTLMLGDHLQIPPIANEVVVKLCKDEGNKTDLLEMSFFEFLFTKLEKKDPNNANITRLDEQFRMPGNISDVISDWFYGGNYHAHYNMSKWSAVIPGTTTPLIMISTSKCEDRFELGKDDVADPTPGYRNPLEADIIVKIIKKVLAESSALDISEIGVISAYGKQVRMIRKEISRLKLGLTQENVYGMAASLDSFQGQERDLIIYSSTRSTDDQNRHKARVGFMKELRRLNVAFTRCKKQLVIIGDFDYLTTCEYEEIDPETNEPVPNKSEKKYAEFIQKMVDQAKSEKGEFYYLDEFYRKAGIE